MLTLDIYNKTKTAVPARLFQKLLPDAEKNLLKDKKTKPRQKFHLELTLVGDAIITQLNKKYHHKNRPTDVISLSYFDEVDPTDPFVGEIFISLPYARRQAAKIGQSLEDELQFLFIHGLLHCFAYDHKKPIEEKHMLKLTYWILKRT